MHSYDHLLKLLLVGDSGVGKTSLLLCFTTAEFIDDQKSTIGVDLKLKLMNVKGKRLKLTIWDTAGQERFRTLTSAYYRGAQGIILVYDVTRKETFENVKQWIQEVDIYSTHEHAVKMLVANKIDQDSSRVVTKEQGREFARQNNMLFIETSAKTNQHVEQAFEELVLKIIEIPSLVDPEDSSDLSLEHSSDAGLCGYCTI